MTAHLNTEETITEVEVRTRSIHWSDGIRTFQALPICTSCGQLMTPLFGSRVMFCATKGCLEEKRQYDVYSWPLVIAKRRE